jgi:hypothetical protein
MWVCFARSDWADGTAPSKLLDWWTHSTTLSGSWRALTETPASQHTSGEFQDGIQSLARDGAATTSATSAPKALHQGAATAAGHQRQIRRRCFFTPAAVKAPTRYSMPPLLEWNRGPDAISHLPGRWTAAPSLAIAQLPSAPICGTMPAAVCVRRLGPPHDPCQRWRS